MTPVDLRAVPTEASEGTAIEVSYEIYEGAAPPRRTAWQEAPSTTLVELYRSMVRVRAVDQALWNLSIHRRIGVYTPVRGQEAAQVGATLALQPRDWMVPTFRELGAQLCRGEPLDKIILFHRGFEEGSVSQSFNLPIAAPVASQLPHGAGLAWAARLDDEGQAVLAFLGDGATSKGDFHEAMNLAAVLGLPLVCFCQNNQWALSTPFSDQTATATLAQKATAYGIVGLRVNGDDVLSVYRAATYALDEARQGRPMFIEAVTQRRAPHSTSDNPKLYGGDGPTGEDPLEHLRAILELAGLWDEEATHSLEEAIDAEVGAALPPEDDTLAPVTDNVFEFAYSTPPAEVTAQQARHRSDIRRDPRYDAEPALTLAEATEGTPLTMVQALNLALHEELDQDDDVLVIGEDVSRLGGIFRVTQDLRRHFGPDRVVDTPLAESAIAGSGVGLALAGKRPVCEIQFSGFLYAAFDQLRSHASRFRSRSRGRLTVPLVVRAPFGAGVGAPEGHSDSVEMLFARCPGLKVVVASSPRRARALLKAAIRDPDPVLFLEPVPLYRTVREVVPDEEEVLPLGRAFLVRPGTDLTLVSYGATLAHSLSVADTLAADGHSVEVLDLASLAPLDTEAVIASVTRTGKLLVAHEGYRRGDIAAELCARLKASLAEDFAFARVCTWDVPLPFHGRESAFLPHEAHIAEAARTLLEG